jgi:undecaprenyl diphosphate synthase
MEKAHNIAARLDKEKIPKHVAIIMDGNGRWAERQGKTRIEGHEAGARNVKEITEACQELGVKVLTLYAFSTENWRRSKQEIDALFHLMGRYMKQYSNQLHKTHVRLLHMGENEGLPPRTIDDIQKGLELTKNNQGMDVCVGFNYGGRREIVRAARLLAEAVRNGTMNPEDITEESFARQLYLPEHSEVDLLIRTSGEFRISNFMLWQISYSEIVVSPTLWPDFSKIEFYKAIEDYQSRLRRFGGRP